ncbi:MAG: asparagine synthase (glutamine-hydrolyzing) [Phycisphaerae bacterium]|nr:asparagine synthase (glutamine-hydrolyzing) [Phycisphaerae bacterium]
MCGIAGLIRWHQQLPSVNPDDLQRWNLMLGAIAHRGPNAPGEWVDPRTHASVLLHARLPIIDLPGGRQPMANEDQLVQVVFNGEIYNHHDLRNELRAAGHIFHTDHSDTEVLVHGWEQWQTDLPAHLLGMFSFAVWDMRSNALFLCRDRLGQKPLFFMPTHEGIAFASTINALVIAHGGPSAVPMTRIAAYLTAGYFAPPHTIYPTITALTPGTGVFFTADFRKDITYWQPSATVPPTTAGGAQFPREPADQLRNLLAAAVVSQLRADVPLTCFLSGGVDSSIIAALVQQHQLNIGGSAITTLSVGFAEAGFDESAHAATVARHIGSRHQEIHLPPRDDVMDTLDWLMRYVLGQPFADSSLLPAYHLANAARGLAPVALSGDGADECFGGYDRYRAMRLLTRWPRTAKAATWLPTFNRAPRWRRLRCACAADGWANQYAGLTNIFTPLDLKLLLPDVGLPIAETFEVPSSLVSTHSHWRSAMLLDQHRYLPGDVLWKVDGASMANALEVRSPFLDHRVVEFANTLPNSLIVNRRRGKLLLRQAFGPLLPRSVFTRKKHGFAVPVGQWFRGPLREPLLDRLRDSAGFCHNYLSSAGVQQLVHQHLAREQDHTHRLFALLMLEIWFHQFHPSITD